jgi:hypothetical protein
MRNLLLAIGMVGVVSAAAGCGDKERSPVADDGKGGTGGKSFAPVSGKSGNDEGGAGGGPAVADPLAPVVNITSPAAVDDPNEGAISGTEIEVLCTATSSSEPDAEDLDRASVKLQLLDAEGELVEEKPGDPTTNADEYSSTFIVTNYPAGPIGFRCTATDDAGSHTGEDEIGNFLDKGPIITFIKPDADSAHPLGALLSVEFEVEPSLLSEDDDGATVESVMLEAGGVPIPLTKKGEGVYRLSLDLTDPDLFSPAPNGSFPLTVSATNSRSPTPVKAVTTQDAAVDGAGPTLKITFPGNEAVVGGKVPLTFEASDEVSGIDPESIVVTLNSVEHPYNENNSDWGRPMANTFVYEFDSRLPLVVGDAKVQITVHIEAKDKVGNPAEVAASVLLYLDNYPPSVDLDPLNIRSINDAGECSISFDPLGNVAVNDEDAIGTAGTFRAMVWEETNSLEGLEVLYHAGTNPERTRLYLQPAGALLVDTDDDPENFCDDVADPESDASFALDPVGPLGTPSWGHDDGEYPTSASLGCETRDPDPAELIECGPTVNSDMWQVIKHGNGENVVYGVQVAAATCTGSGWEFGSLVSSDGWVCFAARAVDNVENVGVSRPLRVCVDDPNVDGVPACKTGAPPPSCTDGCTPAPRWDGRFVKVD